MAFVLDDLGRRTFAHQAPETDSIRFFWTQVSGGGVIILNHLGSTWTDVKNLLEKLGVTFSGLSGGPGGVFGPKMGGG